MIWMGRALNLAVALASLVALSGATLAAKPVWLGAFGHVPTPYNQSPPVTTIGRDGNPRIASPGYAPLPAYRAETTVREVVRLSIAARSIRVRFGNEFGGKELHIGEAHIALAAENGEIIPGSDHVLAFAGRQSAVIPSGAPLLSDPLVWPIPALSKLAVTIFYPDETVPPAHTLYALNAWAAPGNQAGANTLMDAGAARSGNHLSEVDVVPQDGRHAVVCFGDSITEGVASTVGAFRGWPDQLAERLQANPLHARLVSGQCRHRQQ